MMQKINLTSPLQSLMDFTPTPQQLVAPKMVDVVSTSANLCPPTPRKDLDFKITDADAQAECHWQELISDTGPNTIVGVFYRHPSGKADKFLAQLESTLKKIRKENSG